MANDNLDIDTPSKLSESSADFRTCSVAKNSCGYTPGHEYCPAVSETISDGDNKGRDPEDGNQHNPNIGTTIDIAMREKLMAKNADLYSPGNEYCRGHEDTIADGDEKGRDPEDGNQSSLSIGTKTDIAMRECLLAKNSDLYSRGNEYCAGHADTIADGDERGREPEDGAINEAGTKQDFQERADLLKKNPYNSGNEYCAGGCNV